MSLVTVAEFQTYVGRDEDPFSEAEQRKAQLHLDDATATVEDEVGQPLAESTDDVELNGSGSCDIVVPRWPVSAVADVVVVDADGDETALVEGADYTWSASGVLTRRGGVWPVGARNVRLTLTAGYAVVSNDVKRIVRRLAASAWDSPIGASQEQLGDRNVRYSAPGGELTTGEKRTLTRYATR